MQTEVSLIVRAISVVTVAAGAALVALCLTSMAARIHDLELHDMNRLWWIALYLLVVGIGLFRHRIWAAILLGVPLAVVGVVIAFSNVRQVSGLGALPGILYGTFLLVPSFVLFYKRRYLRAGF